MKLISMFLMIGLLIGCKPDYDKVSPLEGSSWHLIFSPKIQLEFKSGRIAGHAGCNHYFGTYNTYTKKNVRYLVIEGIGHSLIACMDNKAMTQEDSYIKSLGNAKEYRIRLQQLEIVTEEGPILLFAPLKSITIDNPF
jgi:heat shock protein HslJ